MLLTTLMCFYSTYCWGYRMSGNSLTVLSMKTFWLTARGGCTQMASLTPLVGCCAVTRITTLQHGTGPSGSCTALIPVHASSC